jgi:uncharacterized protein (TIGR03663 family)
LPTSHQDGPSPDSADTVIRLSFSRPLYLAGFGLILLLSLIARLYRLDERPIHQDESAIATLAWNLFQGKGYQYNPQHHGPFLYYLDAAIFFLFGTSDYTSRLGQAVCGAGLVALVYGFREQLGRAGLLAAAFLLGFSPTFLYYTRFGKPDPFLILFAVLLLFLFLRYRAHGAKSDLLLFFASLSLLFCTKENAFLYAGVFLSFLGILVVHRILASESTLRGEWRRIVRHVGENRKPFALGLVLFWAIFILLFSSFFSNPGGILDGLYRKSLTFWVDQHYQPKGWEAPFSFYLPLLALYELPVAIFLFCGFFGQLTKGWVSRLVFLGVFGLVCFLAISLHREFPRGLLPVVYFDQTGHAVIALYALVIGSWSVWRYLKQGRGFRAFLVYWTVLSFVGYSSIRIKAPWFFIHLLLPQVLLAAAFFGDFWESPFRVRHRRFGHALAALLTVITIHHTVLLNYYRAWDPRERMVTAQTLPDYLRLQSLIGDLAFRTATGYDMPIAVQEPAAWPMAWYLREYKNWYHFGDIEARDRDKIIVIGDWNDRDKIRNALGPDYVETWFPHRGWYLMDTKDMTVQKAWRWFLHHEPFNSITYSFLAVYIRKDLLANLLQAGRI